MDETIYVIFKVQFDFALEVWLSIYFTVCAYTHADLHIYCSVRRS